MSEFFRQNRRAWLAGGLLLALTLAAYWPVLKDGFSSYDDVDYVTENAHVQAGLTWNGLVWALGTMEAANWHPLTWLSHMLDVQLFGVHAAGHHLTNLLLHLVNSLLVLFLLQRLTRQFWRSAFVAALFALHPLHVESVAWVAERKDVLSGFFFLLTLWAYTAYAAGADARPQPRASAPATRHPTPGIGLWYILSLVLFALGLMSKPMLVTLPFVLLLLDYWPLQRLAFQQSGWVKPWLRLLPEKVPFFLLSAGSSVMTFIAQSRGDTVSSLNDYPLHSRLAEVAGAYLQYLGKMLWPVHLAVFYPHPTLGVPGRWAGWQLGLSAVVLLGITALAWLERRRAGWFIMGWLWFLGMMVPVIGLVQVGTQAMADRYTYLPLLGIFICLAWGGGLLVEARFAARAGPPGGAGVRAKPGSRTVGWKRAVMPVLGVGLLLACAGLTRRQVSYWRDDFTLFEHALAINERNATAHASLGLAWGKQRKYGLAIAHCRAAIQADPSYAPAWHTLGDIHLLLGKFPEALQEYHTALRWKPNSAWSWAKLGYLNAVLNHPKEAEEDYRQALKWKPDLAFALNNLGALLTTQERRQEALDLFAESARLAPKDPERRYNLGTTLADLKRPAEAEVQLRAALELQPDYLAARTALAGVLAQTGRAAEAAAAVEEASRQCPGSAQGQFQLGNALWNAGLTNDALAAFGRAARLEPGLPKFLLRGAEAFAEQGRIEEAIRQFRTLLVITPNDPEAHQRLGLLLANQGKLDEAILQLNEAVMLTPSVDSEYYLALLLARKGSRAQAVEHYALALRAQPDSAPALNDLAWIRATAPEPELRNGPEAVRLAEHACKLSARPNAHFLGTLAAAYAEAGRFDEAIATGQKALELAPTDSDTSLVASAQARLELYRKHQPCRQ